MDDDRQIGRVLRRREVLALLGLASAGLVVGCSPGQSASPTSPVTPQPESATAAAQSADPTAVSRQAAVVASAAAASTAVPGCVVRPEMTEGPYYVDENLERSDVRSDPATGEMRPGTPLVLKFQVSQVASGRCAPLQGAKVEIWHCDAAGVYSDVSDPGFNTKGQKWLRGSQTTDASGAASFTTIYPGWYSGRAVHIHFKIRPTASTVFTSQLFFDEATTDEAHAQAPYASKGKRDTPNSRDSIYRNGGDQLLLKPAKAEQGYSTDFSIGVDQSALGTSSGATNPSGPGGPPPAAPRPGG